MTITRISNNFAWMCSAPSYTEEPSVHEIEKAIRVLVACLPSVIDPAEVDSIIGPRQLVATFIETWVAQMQERGMQLKALDPYFESNLSYGH